MPTDRVALTVLQANNIGTTIRCAVAFGASRMLLVGQRRYSAHGAHGSDRHIQGRTQVPTLLPSANYTSVWSECAVTRVSDRLIRADLGRDKGVKWLSCVCVMCCFRCS
jgi:tRNA C32,U32 (ribose-2'-O)-methylase TrmJ